MEQILEKYITKFYASGRSFYIVLSQDGYYLAIEDKYVDSDGKLNTALNGIQTCASQTCGECIRQTIDTCKVDELVAKGIEPLVAGAMVFLHTDYETASARVKAVKEN